MRSVFLGAGFGRVAGLPLAGELFDRVPRLDRAVRQDVVDRAVAAWERWADKHGGTPEEYLASLQPRDIRWADLEASSTAWHDALRFLGLTFAALMGRVNEWNSGRITHHDVFRASGVPFHEAFWDILFATSEPVTVLTTNYDLTPERGLRLTPHASKRRRRRPGFNYGVIGEVLVGPKRADGYNRSHSDPVLRGTVPLLKLHGSINWGIRAGKVDRHVNCQPAISGVPAIVAPMRAKQIPSWGKATWAHAGDALRSSAEWIFVGYSFPPYDRSVMNLIEQSAPRDVTVRIIDPSETPALRVATMLRAARIERYPGLEHALPRLTHDLNISVSSLPKSTRDIIASR